MNNCSGAFYEAFTNEINNRWVLDSGYGVFCKFLLLLFLFILNKNNL